MIAARRWQRRSSAGLVSTACLFFVLLVAQLLGGGGAQQQAQAAASASTSFSIYKKKKAGGDDDELGTTSTAGNATEQAANSTSSTTSNRHRPPPQPFRLYEDFDLSDQITGSEKWSDLLFLRNQLQKPALSFYVDKVARKRWLPTQGYNQPSVRALLYADEILPTTADDDDAGDDDESAESARRQKSRFLDEVAAIIKLLPHNTSYAAKPSHMSHAMGNWLVDDYYNYYYDDDEVEEEVDEEGVDNDNTITTSAKTPVLRRSTRFSLAGKALTIEDDDFDVNDCASALAAGLHMEPAEFESWTLKNVRPGLVVEDRWSSLQHKDHPPDEFCIFTMWGKVWVGQWNTVVGQERYFEAFVYRNRTIAQGGHELVDGLLPTWIPWNRLIEIAEQLGANKDMFRTDIFVGIPTSEYDEYQAAVTEAGGSEAEADVLDDLRSRYLQIAVSECEIFPTTVMEDDDMTSEGARLWLEGYNQNRMAAAAGGSDSGTQPFYELVPNTEIPDEYKREGRYTAQCSSNSAPRSTTTG